MKFLDKIFGKKETVSTVEEEYSFCETLTGVYWHIRKLTPIGKKLSGGADTPSLCGMKVEWDIQLPVDIRVTNNSNWGCCQECAKLYKELKK